MPSITTWTRLEPRSRGDDLRPSLEARIHDPAWLLARQWQVAEFRGEDAAFPIEVAYNVTVEPLTGFQPPLGPPQTPPQFPLEAAVAPEALATRPPGESAEAGAELIRLLAAHGCSQATITNIIAAQPLAQPDPATTDPQGLSFLSVLAARLPDTTTLAPILRQATAPGGMLPAALGVLAADSDAVTAAANAWLNWLDTLELGVEPAADTWRSDRLEHRFTLTAASSSGSPLTLSCPQWPGGHLDWYDFDVSPTPPAGGPAGVPTLPGVDPRAGTISSSGPPHPLSYPGAPDRRHWSFEEANVNLADINVAPDDLARMLVVEFASVYAADWYLQPIELPVGALHTISQLTVTNTFGESVSLGPAAPSLTQLGGSAPGTPDWSLFRSTVLQSDGTRPTLNALFLPCTASDITTSSPIEEIALIRDETANIAWAIEQTVQGAAGSPLDRYTQAVRLTPVVSEATPPDDGTLVRYLLETDVPEYCYPLVPDPDGTPKLVLLVLRRVGADGAIHDVLPLGAVLGALHGFALYIEELPLEGIKVMRRRCLTRGFDGTPLLWTARQKDLGATFGSVPLAFDQAGLAT